MTQITGEEEAWARPPPSNQLTSPLPLERYTSDGSHLLAGELTETYLRGS